MAAVAVRESDVRPPALDKLPEHLSEIFVSEWKCVANNAAFRR